MVDKTLVNPAYNSPLYAISYIHIPYDELGEQGKAARLRFWKRAPYLPGLAKEEDIPITDMWDPIED
jgi:hypothetical protein